MEFLTGYTGITTILISFLGVLVSIFHYQFYKKSDNRLSQYLRYVFFTDGLIYFITAMFGIWAYFHWSFEIAMALQLVRIPILILNITASVLLYRYYKNI